MSSRTQSLSESLEGQKEPGPSIARAASRAMGLAATTASGADEVAGDSRALTEGVRQLDQQLSRFEVSSLAVEDAAESDAEDD